MTVDEARKEEVRKKVVAALRTIHDPEIPVNIYDLGLIYGIDIDDELNIKITFTLTAPACPIGGFIHAMIEETVKEYVPEAKSVTAEMVWEPVWTPDKVTPEGREMLQQAFGYDVVGEWLKSQQQQKAQQG